MTNLVDAGDYKAAGRFASPFDLVDETTCAKSADVQCVKVVSRSLGPGSVPRQYYPTEMVLYRGWRDNERKTVAFVPSATDLNGWTDFWATSADSAGCTDPMSGYGCKGQETTFRPKCGLENTMLFGELLTHIVNVPSPCHCK